MRRFHELPEHERRQEAYDRLDRYRVAVENLAKAEARFAQAEIDLRDALHEGFPVIKARTL